MKKLIRPEHIHTILAKERENGRRIAAISGSFDVLHAGHVRLLREAAGLGQGVHRKGDCSKIRWQDAHSENAWRFVHHGTF